MRKKALSEQEIEEAHEAYCAAMNNIAALSLKADQKARESALCVRVFSPVSSNLAAVRRGIAQRSWHDLEKAKSLVAQMERDLRCGAKTRQGTPCQCQPEPGKKRCKFHGGRSTGAKTAAGLDAIRESNRRRAQSRREARGEVSQ